MPTASAPQILILTGPPGVGKTTVAAALARRFDRAVHLEADAFFRFVATGFIDPTKTESHEQNEVVMGAAAAAAAHYAAGGYLTIVDGIVIPRWFLQPLRGTLAAAGHPVAYAVLRAPSEICLARVQNREGELPMDSAALERLWGEFADLGELEANAIDVEGRTADDAAGLLAERLSSGQLTI